MLMKTSILYFDDEETLLEIFRAMFADQYEVRTTTSLVEARRQLSQCTTDIIISDQNMPEIEGTEFLREASEVCPQSVRILLTGHITVGEVFGEVITGIIQSFVPKPWTMEEMQRVLERAGSLLEK